MKNEKTKLSFPVLLAKEAEFITDGKYNYTIKKYRLFGLLVKKEVCKVPCEHGFFTTF